MTGTLYLVSTPIGNINDISIRAIDILTSVDIILTEDTRVTSKLLKHHSVVAKSSLQSFNQINEDRKAPNIILSLKEGKDIALVSDAGTPLISDPGYKFIKHARESNIKVEPVPGCCALIAAITSSGLPSDRFSFHGFLPRSSSKRITELNELNHNKETLIFNKTGLPIDSYFSGTKIKWILDNVRFANIPRFEVSSTNIRARWREGKTIRYMVPKEVWEYINENELYLSLIHI